MRTAVEADPVTFVSGPGPMFIDEYQHVPMIESVQAGQILEVTLWTPDVAAGCGRHLDHQRTQQVGTRRR